MNTYKKFFSFYENNQAVMFDNAASSLILKKTQQDFNRLIENFSLTSKRNFYSFEIDETIKNCKKKISDFFGLQEKHVFFGNGSTFTFNRIAIWLLQTNVDYTISLSKHAHNSFIAPFLKCCNRDFYKKKQLHLITHVSNVSGERFDFEKTEKNKQIVTIVDCAQTGFYLEEIAKNLEKIDIAVFSAHKIFGIQSSFSVLSERMLKIANKYDYIGGGVISDFDAKQLIFRREKNNLQPGTPNVLAIQSISNSFDFILKHKNEYFKIIDSLKRYFIQQMRKLAEKNKRLVLLKKSFKQQQSAIFIFCFKHIYSQDAEHIYLNNEIYVRSGQQCNDITLKHNNWIRVSFQIYNSTEEIKQFLQVTKKILAV